MKDHDLKFDRSCHVLYTRPCKKQIRMKIALHYPPEERETVWNARSDSSTSIFSPTGAPIWAARRTSTTAAAAITIALR